MRRLLRVLGAIVVSLVVIAVLGAILAPVNEKPADASPGPEAIIASDAPNADDHFVVQATQRPRSTKAPRPTQAPRATEIPVVDRCIPVPRDVARGIADGLTVAGKGALSKARAVRSRDYERVWFVAAEIRGPGMDNVVGVWATNSIDASELGSVFPANGIADEFSTWGDAGPRRFAMTDDGAREAEGCVTSATP